MAGDRRQANNTQANNGRMHGNPNRGIYAIFVVMAVMFVLSESGKNWAKYAVSQAETTMVTLGVIPELDAGGAGDDEEDEEDEAEDQHRAIRAISDHCLPKLVCELYSKETRSQLSESEISLMSLIGVTQLSSAGPSKYHYAAHMGQLTRGFEGGGCHHFFPGCPFSASDVRDIARKVKFSG